MVDDNPADCERVRLALDESGDDSIGFHCAPDLAAALDLVARLKFDVILLDLGLPDAAGLSALNEVRKLEPNVPILILTGDTDPEMTEKALQDGAQDSLTREYLEGEHLRRSILFAIDRFNFEYRERVHLHELKKLSMALSQSNTAVIITDPEGKTRWVNPGFEKICGFSLRELAGKKPGDLLQGPESNPETIRYMSDRIKRKKGFQVELLNYRGGTEPYWISLNVQPALDKDGNVEFFLGIISDVTERREKEAQLQKAKNDAEAANVAKSQFLATMSHEIRTPLNAILGFSQIIKENPDAAERGEYLDIIDQNGRMLADLISDILDFSKIEAGEDELELEESDFKDWLGEVIRLFRDSARESRVSLEWSVDPEVEGVWIFDTHRLRQVLVNLLRNGLKFTEEGFVRVKAFSGRQGGIALTVADSGIGIPEEMQEEIFEPFRPGDSSNARHGRTGSDPQNQAKSRLRGFQVDRLLRQRPALGPRGESCGRSR